MKKLRVEWDRTEHGNVYCMVKKPHRYIITTCEKYLKLSIKNILNIFENAQKSILTNFNVFMKRIYE